MSLSGKSAITVLTAVVSFSTAQVFAQADSSASRKLIILDKTTTLIQPASALNYIGEIKGRSYIKLTLHPLEKRGAQTDETTGIEQYKGSYYESVSGKTYTLTGSFDPGTKIWNLKCYNSRKQYVSLFQGRETSEDVIEGVWKNKHQSLSFYLFKKDTQN